MTIDRTRMYILPCGFIENDVALNVLLANQGTVDEPNKPAQWHRVPSICVLIAHPRLGWILIDTGSHKDATNGRWPEVALRNSPPIRTPDDLLENRLAALGLAPKDIDLLILSHLHLDHAGGLELFAHTPAGSRVIVHELELKQGLYELFVGNHELANAYLRSDFVGLPGIAFDPVHEARVELADDLELLWLPGHTAGLLGVMVHLQNAGTWLFISDAAYTAVNYGPPVRLPGILHDSVALKRSLDQVRWLERRYNATVLFGHDLAQYNSLCLSPEYYD